jgi:hypothetical protein
MATSVADLVKLLQRLPQDLEVRVETGYGPEPAPFNGVLVGPYPGFAGGAVVIMSGEVS